jgi:hypothetical protein
MPGWPIDSAMAMQNQRSRILEAWNRVHTDTGDGAGIAMFSNYSFYSDPAFDSGLRWAYALGGQARHAYDMWQQLGSYP